MRLQPVSSPKVFDRCSLHTEVLRQCARAPVRGCGRVLIQRRIQDARLVLRRQSHSPGWPSDVMRQGRDASGDEAPAPNSDLTSIQMDFERDVLVLPTLCCEQDGVGALLNSPPYVFARQERLQFPFGAGIQFDLVCNSHRTPAFSNVPPAAGDYSAARLRSASPPRESSSPVTS